MNPKLETKWDEAEKTGKPIDIGNIVVCDACNDDYTDREDVGGFIFISNAYCPKCAQRNIVKIRGYGEEHFIRARAEPGEQFRHFVLRLRGGNNKIQVTVS